MSNGAKRAAISLLRGTLRGMADAGCSVSEEDAADLLKAAVQIIELETRCGVLVERLERACELMEATAKFIETNPVSDYEVFYDEALCDGSCLEGECRDWAASSRELLKGLK